MIQKRKITEDSVTIFGDSLEAADTYQDDWADRKPVIWLAGDSMTQSYQEKDRPQTGWGEHLLEYLEENHRFYKYHRANCPFEQEVCYEGQHLMVDNCAMAGRSTKTFEEEGRLEDICRLMKEGDYLLIQFGHNDASSSKPERYVPVSEFAEKLMPYINGAKSCGALPVLLSSVVLCPCEDTETGEKGEIAKSLPDYGEVMRRLAEKEGIPYVDMGGLIRSYFEENENRKVEKLYMPDHVHLSPEGAGICAGLAAKEINMLLKRGCVIK